MDKSLSQPFAKRLWHHCIIHHIADWITLLAILAIYIGLEFKTPFHRQFSLDDVTLQHPIAPKETVTSLACVLISLTIPSFVIVVVTSIRHNPSQALHVGYVSILGLATSFIINGAITNFLKVFIGRPRPDFLARCMPSAASIQGLATMDICTNPDLSVIEEGFKSTPSGHSSSSFSAFFYLSLWLSGQLYAYRPGAILIKGIATILPSLFSTWIALSRTVSNLRTPYKASGFLF